MLQVLSKALVIIAWELFLIHRCGQKGRRRILVISSGPAYNWRSTFKGHLSSKSESSFYSKV